MSLTSQKENKKMLKWWIGRETDKWQSNYSQMLIVESDEYPPHNSFNFHMCLKHFVIKCQKINLFGRAWFWGKRDRSFGKSSLSIPSTLHVIYGNCKSLLEEAMKKNSLVKLHSLQTCNQSQEKTGLVKFCFIIPIQQILIDFNTFLQL